MSSAVLSAGFQFVSCVLRFSELQVAAGSEGRFQPHCTAQVQGLLGGVLLGPECNSTSLVPRVASTSLSTSLFLPFVWAPKEPTFPPDTYTTVTRSSGAAKSRDAPAAEAAQLGSGSVSHPWPLRTAVLGSLGGNTNL